MNILIKVYWLVHFDKSVPASKSVLGNCYISCPTLETVRNHTPCLLYKHTNPAPPNTTQTTTHNSNATQNCQQELGQSQQSHPRHAYKRRRRWHWGHQHLLNCRRPSGPKPEIQDNRRGRGVPTLTWEEVTISEGKRSCCSCSKKEIMSLGFYLKVIYKSACKELCISQRQQQQKVGVGTLPTSERIHILY
jgi:hypothetical protein